MPKILVCQHVAYEPLGVLDPLLREAGFRIRYVNFGRLPAARPGLGGYDGLVVLGGPMNVHETDRYPHLCHEMDLIREAVEREMPVLGICLGAQLMARALGGEVFASPKKEIGWYDLDLTEAGRASPLLASFRPREAIFQWHAYTFSLPPGAMHLASSAACRYQAFAAGERAYGFQFHLEVDRALVRRWLTAGAHRQELEEMRAAGRLPSILEDTERYIDRSLALARDTFGRFIALFARRRRVLVHRIR